MTKHLRELYDQKRAMIEEAKDIIKKEDVTIDEIESKNKELTRIQNLIQLEEVIDNEEHLNEGGFPKKTPFNENKNMEYNADIFCKVLTGSANELEKNIAIKYRNALQVGSKEDGGYTVPDDVTNEIIKEIISRESVRNLVRVENTKTMQGHRIVQTGEPTMLYNTAERGSIQKINNPNYEIIKFAIKKYAGLMDISSELLDDSFVNFMNEMRNWLADSARNTENENVLYGNGVDNPVGILTEDEYYKEVKAPEKIDIKFLRRIRTAINSGYRVNSKWVMNTEAFNILADIEDKNGRGILAEDPRNRDSFTLFGRPIEVYDTIKTKADKTVIMFGDFNRAYRIFDRKGFSFRITDTGAGTFETDTHKARAIIRFDGQRMDKNAIVIVRDVDVSFGEEVGTDED